MPKIDLYNKQSGQAQQKENEENLKKKKAKDREKRIRENRENQEDDFAMDTEMVIQMTNKNKIKKDEERKRKLIQEETIRKKRNKKVKLALKTVLSLGIIGGAIAFAMISPIFNIKEIQVLNNQQISSEMIISLSELKVEENIFRFNSSKVARKIQENAYVEAVKIHRKIPDTIQIEVEERIHNYSVDFLGKYAYINSQGYILEMAEDSKQKPILQGITTPEEQVVVGSRLSAEDLKKMEDVIKIMNATKEYNLDTKITSIDISNKNQYSLYLEEERKKIHLGDNSNLSNKMLYVNAIIEEERGKSGEIFANGDLNHKFKIYFRESLNV